MSEFGEIKWILHRVFAEELDMHEILKKITVGIADYENKTWEMDIAKCDWVAGVGLYGFCKAHERTGDDEILNFLSDWVERNIDEAIKMPRINTAILMYTVLYVYRQNGNENYLNLCKKIADYFLYEAPKTREGALEHTVIEDAKFSEQVWADTLFMAVIFLAEMGKYDKKYGDFAAKQLCIHLECLHDNEKDLYFHAWNSIAKNHMSAVRWGRANAWIIYGATEITRILGDFEGAETVKSHVKKHAAALKAIQTQNGAFRTVLDEESYEEASATAGLIAGIKQAVQLGIIEKEYLSMFDKGIEYLVGVVAETGEVTEVSFGTPVLKSSEEYKNIICVPTLYGQGLAAIALALN